MPYVLASNLVGEVVTVGTGEYSAKFIVSKRVFGHTFAEGGFYNDFNGAQQYALVDTRFIGRVAGSGLSNDEASTIPVIVLAGFITLFASFGHGLPPPFSLEAKSFKYANITLLIIRGSSNTGQAIVKLAKLVGIGRIIAVAGHCHNANLKSVGATHVINRRAPDMLDQIRAITGDKLVYAVNTVNAGMEQELGVAALSNTKKGTLITLCRPDRDFNIAWIGSKSAGYECRLVFSISSMYPEVTVGF